MRAIRQAGWGRSSSLDFGRKQNVVEVQGSKTRAPLRATYSSSTRRPTSDKERDNRGTTSDSFRYFIEDASASAVRGEDGPADVAVGGHGCQFPPGANKGKNLSAPRDLFRLVDKKALHNLHHPEDSFNQTVDLVVGVEGTKEVCSPAKHKHLCPDDSGRVEVPPARLRAL
ncbi:hypothetical protein EYF80_031702 [Liparis tanakae]|uniref:Uncharacterized protein n=1 Tax=Liparis tanakae TaxID=230148 RepID=A0A4Z2GZ97_9TELE|nr:hypothetical protein EYF80_031702 [Liparis tanakae]